MRRSLGSFCSSYLSGAPPPSSFPPQEPRNFFGFEILHKSKKSNARVGRITTPHGTIDTPGFVPVATNATLKCVSPHEATKAQTQLTFCNTYHLLLQPGPEVIKKAGGLHKFMNYNQPLITDSGGFQVFSLGPPTEGKELKGQSKKDGSNLVLKVDEEGVLFRSYKDGSAHLLTPTSSVDYQKAYGADIIIPLDELPPQSISREKLISSFARTHRWQAQSLSHHLKDINNQAMYSVLHGGGDSELRKVSFDYLTSLPFDGLAIGGSLGANHDEMHGLLTSLSSSLEQFKDPIHLLGIGDLHGISLGIPFGIDTFDSSYPTKIARHGHLLSFTEGRIDIRKKIYQDDFTPLDSECEECRHYTKAYLHHLFRANEPAYQVLASKHNIYFMMSYMKKVREKILNDEL